MAELILSHDWASTSLGPISNWPSSLLITLGNILHSSFPTFLFWGEDLICFYNDAYRPSLGANGKHPAIGKTAKEVWPEVWDFVEPIIRQVLTTGKPAWFENRLVPIFRNNKVEDVYWTFSHSPAFGENGKIFGVIVTCIETTQHVLAQQIIEQEITARTRELEKAQGSLISANVYLQQIINLFKEPLQILEPIFKDGEIVDFKFKLTNAAYSAYANATPEELQGKRVGEVFPGYFQTSSFTKPIETFSTGKPDTWEIHYDQDGLDLYNRMSATKLGDAVVLHFTDFTKLKHLQLELERKIAELERSNKSLGEFAHAASHDLKEPIRKIQIFISQLRTQLAGTIGENLPILDKIENSADRMYELIDDLIEYSHVSAHPLEKEDVNLNQTIKNALEELELAVAQKKAVVKSEILPNVRGYSRQLQQLFQNLISNAIKYAKDNIAPSIEITSRLDNVDGKSFHVVTVKDNGIGFDQQYEHKIFEMFARLHGKNQYTGNGIGLSIVKKIVNNHHGMIKARSAVGEGSIFEVYIPT